MRIFKNVKEIKEFCNENNISFDVKDKKDDLLDRIQKWEDAELARLKARAEKADAFNAYEFGQLYKLDQVSIKYLKRCFGDEKNTYSNWIQVCKDKKVID